MENFASVHGVVSNLTYEHKITACIEDFLQKTFHHYELQSFDHMKFHRILKHSVCYKNE